MLADIKNHCPDAKFKRVGSGTYCEAFKFFYNKDDCHQPECPHCKEYPQSGNYVIKEIQKTIRYGQSDFDCEIQNQKAAMEYMPDLVVNIFESWNEVLNVDNDGNISGNLGTKSKTNIIKGCIIAAYGYITMEYMNYKDLYLNYKAGKPTLDWSRPINMTGLVFICLIILYNLHCKLGICHGDFRDTNIFLKYVAPDYMQKVCVELDNTHLEFLVNTGGFHIKLGDFGLSETLCGGIKSFIFRDYEFMENIYKNREMWKWMMPDKNEYNRLISFLQNNFIHNINQRIDYYHYFPEQIKSRTDFWYAKHSVSQESMYLYEFPKLLLRAFINTFHLNKTSN
jgi:serine/threonine protein kinase